ncbi:MAG: hypothetical protein WDW38_009265 [Sanguina aurantia]
MKQLGMARPVFLPQDLPFYCQYPLDRRAELRRNNEQLSKLRSLPTARVLPVMKDKVLVKRATAPLAPGQASLQAVYLESAASVLASDHIAAGSPSVFLGVDPRQGTPYFAAEVSQVAGVASALATANGAEWRSARLAGPELDSGEASLLAVGSSLMQWHGAAQFSSRTGSAMAASPGGHSRKCGSSGSNEYPRLDTAVIMLVTCGEYCLLGRKPEWPQDRYSTLAGFVEVGEPLEVTVVREVAEESGVTTQLGSVRYEASQPWPFPRSLMIGFNGRSAAIAVGILPAEVESVMLPLLQPPVAQADELADVRWFHRDFLMASILTPAVAPVSGTDGSGAGSSGGGTVPIPGHSSFNIPGSYSLAHRLITKWLGVSASAVLGTSLDGMSGQAPENIAASRSGSEQPGHKQQSALLSFPTVSLDDGTFKYVLLRVTDPSGAGGALALGKKLGLEVRELGGGRITHDAAARKARVYGYSAAFGAAPHELSQAILRRHLPLYDDVTVSYEGY